MSNWENQRDYRGERERGYGNEGRGYDAERRYRDSSSYAQRYNYPSGYRSGETYGGHGAYEDTRGRYGTGEDRSREYGRGGYGLESNPEYGRGDYGSGEERGWWDRASDAVASWFGDEEAERRRRMDEQRQAFRGRGPKGYRRSDERIKEDVNDRLSEGYLDATEIEVSVQNAEVTLTGTVNNRNDKRRAEDIAESVSGVSNVENRIRVKRSDLDRYTGTEMTGTTGITGTTGTAVATGTTDTSSSAAMGTPGTARGKGASS
jgi:osmotically-inducible protein OsmY